MGNVRGIFPLFLATTFGILNGIAVFGPAFKDQQRQKLEDEQKDVAIAHDQDVTKLDGVQKVEAAPISEDIPAPGTSSTSPGPSRWSITRFWEGQKSNENGKLQEAGKAHSSPIMGHDGEETKISVQSKEPDL
ncbi:MAG: hypothetical protein Q9187_002123 [Circinaria calcarea]